MPIGKVRFSIGDVSFSSEGDQEWVAKQLDKIIKQAKDLIKLAPVETPMTQQTTGSKSDLSAEEANIATKALATFLKEVNADRKQIDKFLATSIWLHARGQKRLESKDVTAALKTANQTRLSNPADCLNKNSGKGFAEKDGTTFFVTDQGREYILK